MQNQTSIYIPKPCHEDWNKMTPTQQGKFCGSCSKQVIDFSLMNDNQILKFLSGKSGKLCGRFDADQLQRPLTETNIKKKKSWWMALTMPLLFLFDRSEAQEKIVGDTTYNISAPGKTVGKLVAEKTPVCKPSDTSTVIITGGIERKHKIDIAIQKNTITITGKVVDEDNKPLAYASVSEKGTVRGTVTDSLGNFLIDIKSYNNSVNLVASYVGYQAVEKQVSLKEENINITIQLKPAIMGDVVVTARVDRILSGTVGGLTVCRKITTFQKLDTTFKKAIGISTVYPNPAIKGSNIHIQIKLAGEYQLQLFNNQSHLITVENITADSNKSIADFLVPSNIASGIYYVRLMNEQTKKSYTEKLIIQ